MTETNKFKDTHPAIFHQIWGIVFLGIGTYFFIAIVNNYAAPQNPLFGEYLGRHFAVGMKALFGNVMQFFFVPFSFFVAINWLLNRPVSVRFVISAFLYLVFLCTAFAIPNLPIIRLDASIAGGNLLGCAIANFVIYPVFGKAVFGAYFVLFLAMLITAMYMFKINIVELAKKIWAKIKELFAKITKKGQKNESEKPKELQITQPTPLKTLLENVEMKEIEQDFNKNFEEQLKNFSEISSETENLVKKYENTEFEDTTATNGGLAAAYMRPNPAILPNFTIAGQSGNQKRNDEISRQLVDILEEFGVKDCKVVEINPGPIVTLFEIEPGRGVKISSFEGLEKDIGIKIGGKSVRIDTIPNKTTIGIEVPNENREMVYFKEILLSPAFQNSKMILPVIIGKGTTGEPLVEDIAKMPHILIAGQTGSGKSVGINSFIASLLFGKTPDELRLIMIDPKKVEMACYDGIPHLAAPVVTEVEKAVKVLEAATKEMDARYDLLKKVGSKNIASFNEKFDNGELKNYVKEGKLDESENRRMCYIVVIIDELADLMMTAGKDVEKYIQRIAQLARAIGIHLIVATQRPDVKVITGNIKANLPSRIAFRVMSYTDSRTILDRKGAEQLLGNGDMLYLKNGAPKIVRYHGAFISEKDVENLVEDIKKQGYVCENMPSFEIREDDCEDDISWNDGGRNYRNDDYDTNAVETAKRSSGRKYGKRDEYFEDAARMIVISKLGSTSSIQRHLNLGYARAGRVMDELQSAGIVGPQEVIGKPRKVLVSEGELDEILERLAEENE